MNIMKILHGFGSGGRSDAPLPAGAVATVGPVCTYCKGTRFYAGPEACGSVNILCANEECRHWFCDIGIPGQPLMDLKRVEPTPDERARQDAERKAAEDARKYDVYMDGRALYCGGRTAAQVLTDANYGGGAAHPDNLLRLAGYIDEMRSRLGPLQP